jgi:hypothetical protein
MKIFNCAKQIDDRDHARLAAFVDENHIGRPEKLCCRDQPPANIHDHRHVGTYIVRDRHTGNSLAKARMQNSTRSEVRALKALPFQAIGIV